MTRKDKKDKVSPESNKNNSDEYEEIDESSEEKEGEIDYDEYEIPEDFELPSEEEEDEEKEGEKWYKKIITHFKEMENKRRLYWIKVLGGAVTGMILGFTGATTGWWLFLMLGLYAAIAFGGMFLFKIKFDWKEILFSGLFPYLALFVLFWTLLFTSFYAPEMSEWEDMLITTITTTEVFNSTITSISTFVTTNTTSAAGMPIVYIILTFLGTITGINLLLKKYKKNKA
jgi:hypothetical protein